MEINKKSDSSIRGEGAEIFVQGYIMLELGYPTALASRNMPGYDILVQNIVNNRSVRIQVKYRSAVDSDGFRFKNFDFDFAVMVIGNLGKISKSDTTKYKPTEFYIFPVQLVKAGIIKGNTQEDLFPLPNRKKHEEKYLKFRDDWNCIVDALERH
jgi:hypothetical protein